MTITDMQIRQMAEELLNEQPGVWALSPEAKAKLIKKAIQWKQQNIDYIKARDNSWTGWALSRPLVKFITTIVYIDAADQEQRELYHRFKEEVQQVVNEAHTRIQAEFLNLPILQEMPAETARHLFNETTKILDVWKKTSSAIQEIEEKLKANISIEERQLLNKKLEALKAEKQEYLKKIKQEAINFNTAQIRKKAEELVNEQPGVWVLPLEAREEAINKAIEQEKQNTAFLEKRKDSWFSSHLITFFTSIFYIDPETQKQMDLYNNLKEDILQKINEANTRIKAELLKFPKFQDLPEEEREKIIHSTVKALNNWMKTKLSIKKIKEKLKAKISPEEKENLEVELLALQAKKQEELSKITQETESVIQFLAEDKEFALKRSYVENVLEYGKETVQQVAASTQVKGAIAGATLAMLAAPKSLAGMLVAGLGGAAVGYQYPQIRYVIAPLKYLYNEIREIIYKPHAYLDRGFRAGTILLATLGMAAGILTFTALVANPFTGVPLLGAVLGVAATVLVAAGAAKLSKWISNTVATKLYGISNPDRYKLTHEGKKLLGNEAEKICQYLTEEITKIKQELKKIPDKSSQKAIRLNNQLTNLEHTWDKIQAGDEKYLSAWTVCARELYRNKKEKYQEIVHHKTDKHAKALPKLLLNMGKEKTTFKALNKKGVKIEKPLKETFSFLNKKGGKTNKALEEIQKLKEIDNKLKKSDKK